MGLSQYNVCLKCNEGRNLLTCIGCPIVIHEGCMTCPAKFDELGNFYCPHCSFKQCVAELSQAREKVKLARKALSIFIGIESKEHNNEAEAEAEPEPERLQQSETGAANVRTSAGHCEKSKQEKNSILYIGSVQLDDENEIRDAERVNEGEETGNVDGEKIQEEESETPLASTDQTWKENSETYEESTDKSGEETGNVEGEKIQEKESETPLASTDQTRKENSGTYEASTDKSGEWKISSKDKDLIGEEDCENSSDSNGGHRSTGHLRAKRRILISDSSCEDIPVRKKHVKQSNRIEQSSPAVKCRHRFPRTHSAQVTNKLSDEEFDDSGSKSSKWIHPKRPSVKLDNNIGNRQRKKVMWTEEEVEMLKIGVEKCSSPMKYNLPWKKILHFGRRVFNKTRTPMDLKDKWGRLRRK